MPDARSDASAPVRHVVVVGGGIAGLAAAWSLHERGRPRRRRAAGDGARGHRPGRRQAAGQRAGRGGGRRGRRVAAAAPARGRRPGPGRRPRRRTWRTRRPPAASVWTRGRLRPLPAGDRDGRAERPARAGRSGLLTARELARVPVDRGCRGRRTATTSRSGRYVARPAGPRGRRPAGRAAARRGLRRPGRRALAGGDRCRSSRRTPGGSARCWPPRGPAGPRPTPGAPDGRSSPRSAAASGRLPAAVAAAVRRRRSAPARPSASCAGRRTAGGSSSGPTRSPEEVRRRRRGPGRARRRRPPGCCARTRRPRRPSWPRSRYASMAVVTLAFPATAFPALPTGSGFLVPPVDGRTVKAVTFSSTKWGWYAGAAPGLVVLRASVGRNGEEADAAARRRRPGRPGAGRPDRRARA